MVGTDAAPFEGTFLGDGHTLTVNIDSSSEGAAPFAFVKGAKINNLNVAGTVKGGNYSSGLIGKVKGSTVDIYGVKVSATVKSGQYLGGFIGHSYEVKSINITGCMFNGTLNCTGSSGYAGGFAGWSDYPGYVIQNCLFAGNVTGKFKLFHPAGIYKASTGGYSGVKYGKVLYTSSGAQKGSGDSTATPLLDWNVSTERVYTPNEVEEGSLYEQLLVGPYKTNCYVKASSCGISIDEVFVTTEYGRDEYETITPSPVIECNNQPYIDMNEFDIKYYRDTGSGYESVDSDKIGEAGDYMVKASGKGWGYCGSVSTNFKVVNFMGTGTEDDPYELYDDNDWSSFVTAVNAGHNFKNKFLILQNDIECHESAGDEKHQFKGTFYGRSKPDGSNVALTASLDDTENQGTAPFRWVSDGAVIHDINVKGTIKGGRHSGGLVGFAGSGTVKIYDVNVSATISNGDYIGGIVGHGKTANLSMINCSFTGTISGGSSYVGGLLGWSDGQRLTLENCMFAGRNMGSGSFHPIAVRNSNEYMNVTSSKVFYLNTQAPNINASNIAASGTPVYKKTDFPEDKLLSKVRAADNNDYYATVKVGKIADSYTITGSGIAPVPAVSDVNGAQLKKGTHYTATYASAAGGDPVDTITQAGEYTLVLKGNKDDTIGAQEVGTFTTEANSIQNVTLNKDSVSLSFDEDENTAQLDIAVEPATVVIKEVEWTSGNTSVATVDENGLVTAKGEGTAVITVKAVDIHDGEATDTCTVTVAKAPAKLIIPPSKNVLTYNGGDQELMNPGEAFGGTIVYALGENPGVADYSANIPKGRNAGTYKVSYMIRANDGLHTDAGPWISEVSIGKAEGGATIEKQAVVTTQNDLDLNTLITGDTSNGVQFEIKEDDASSTISSQGIYSASSYGTCTIEATINERDNYKELKEQIVITVNRKTLQDLEVSIEDWTYGDTEKELVYDTIDDPQALSITYLGTKRNGSFYIDEDPPKDAGDYKVYVIYEDNENIYFGGAEFTIDPKDISGAVVTLGKSLTYNGKEQEQTISKVELSGENITEYCSNGGNYATDEDYDPDADHNQYTVVNAGTYILVVTADETSNYTGSVEKEFEVAKADPTLYKFPKAVKNLVYSGYEQVLVQQGEVQGGVIKYNMGGSGGFTEKLPAAIDAGTYKICYRIKGDANHNNIDENMYLDVTIATLTCSIDKEPQAIEGLEYTGEVQELVEDGDSSNGDIVYRVGDDESAEFSAVIPKAKNASEYKIYYKAIARDDNHSDSAVYGPITVSIEKKDAEMTQAPEAVEGLVYDGEAHELVTAGKVSGGTMVYSFEENGSYSEEIPKADEPGDYSVYYKIDGGDDYKDSDPMGPIQAKVDKAPFPGKVTKGVVRAKYEEQVDISEYVTSDHELEYSIIFDDTENHDCSLEGSVLTTGTGNGKCHVEIGVIGNEGNYEPDYITVNISDITTTDIGVYQDDVIFGKGKVDPKYDDYSGSRSVDALTISYYGTLNNGETYGLAEEESQAAPTESGSYSVDVYYMVGNNVYYGQTDFTIKPADIADAKVTFGKELKYNGSEQTQEVKKVELNGKDITDICIVSDNTATKYGNYTLTVKTDRDAFNYRGEAKVPFTVYPDDATLEAAKKDAIESLDKQYKPENYSGSEKAAVTDALNKAKAAIRKARTLEEIEQAKSEIKKSLSGVKLANTLSVKGKTAKVKYTKLKKKTQKLKVSKVIAFKNRGQGTISYKITSVKKGKKSFKKYFTINKKTGQIKIKKSKKLKKGTYKVKVKVRAAGNAKYEASTLKTVKIKIKVK